MKWSSDSFRYVGFAGSALAVVALVACARSAAVPAGGELRVEQAAPARGGPPAAQAARGPTSDDRIRRGRQLVIENGCGDCHGGGADPAAEGWLAGAQPRTPTEFFFIGPCATQPGATPCFKTRPRNLTPDNTTGLGRFSERQLFNALRYGLRPGETPDVEITSGTPGQGNFPARPKYLAPPMPWPAWRHMPDQDLRDISAYLKQGVRPVRNQVADSDGPPDFWAIEYTVEKIGPYPAPAFPTAREQQPAPAAKTQPK